MNMTKGFLLSMTLAALLPLQSVATAQDQGADRERSAEHQRRGKQNPAHMLRRMERVLELDELQRQNIENLLLAAKPEFDALREATRANRRAMESLDTGSNEYADRLAETADEKGRLTSRKIQLLGNLRADINAELTEEQQATLKSAKDRRAGFRKGRRSERRRHRDAHHDTTT